MTSVISILAGDPSDTGLRMLQERGALPSWFEHTRGWADSFHKNWTSTGWDSKDASIKVISPAHGFGPAMTGSTISIPANVPVFIRAILDSLDAAIVRSENPNSSLRLSCSGIQTTLDRLSQIIGGIRETGMPMFPVQPDPWNPGTIAATHFCYFHELAHVTFANRNQFLSDDDRWTNEFEADKFALACLVGSYRSHSDFLDALALGGPVLAIYFAEIARIAMGRLDAGTNLHPPIRSRVFALRDSVRLAIRDRLIKGNPLPTGDFFAKALDAFVTILESVDYPLFSPVQQFLKTLLKDISAGNHERLKGGCNFLLRWYVLGDHDRIYDSCHAALDLLRQGDANVFDLLLAFVDFAGEECKSVPDVDEFVKFLNKICLFDKQAWEAV